MKDEGILSAESNFVYVKPIKKYTWLPEGHDGEVRFTGCAEHLAVEQNMDKTFNTGLTMEEESRLEKVMFLEVGTLSRYNEKYWGDYRRTIAIPREGLKLDLANPKHELIYKNLLAHSHVANSQTEQVESPYFEYVMTTPQKEAEVKNTKGRVKREAYKQFGKFGTDRKSVV